MREKFTCIVCGRTFYQGQGIVYSLKGNRLYFHSKACAYKFFKDLIEASDPDCLNLKDVMKKYEELEEKRRERAVKRI
jgi:ribosomal protein L24E